MRLTVSALLLSAAVEIVTAAPQPHRRDKRSKGRINVPLTMLQEEYRPTRLRGRQNLNEPGSGSLIYLASLTLGQQAQPYQMLVDTGSTDLTKFNDNVDLSDTTLSDQGDTCAEAYGPGGQTGVTSGEIYNGPYTIADSGPISGLFCLEAPPSGPRLFDGFIGLGLPPGPGGQTVASKTGNNPVTASGWDSFGLYLSSADQGSVGQLTINDADANYYQSEDYWTYENVIIDGSPGSPGYWLIPYGTWAIGSETGYAPNPHGFVDSGSTSIRLDYAAAQAAYNQIAPGALPAPTTNVPGIDCSYKGAAPDLQLTFGSGTVYSIPSSNYIVNGPRGGCFVAIVATMSDQRPAVFGIPFIQTYYTWFDIADATLGFNPSVG